MYFMGKSVYVMGNFVYLIEKSVLFLGNQVAL